MINFVTNTNRLFSFFKFCITEAFEPLPLLQHVDFYNNPKLNYWDFTASFLPPTIVQLGLGYNRLLQKLPTKMLQGKVNLSILNLSRNLFFYLNESILPSDLFPNLKALILESCSISVIDETAFNNLTQLAYLYLGNNQLTEITPGAFPSSLLLLSIRQNPQVNGFFTLSEDTLAGIPELRWLDMNFMNLDTRSLSSNVFDGIGKLTILQMRDSGLDTAISRLFSPLAQLMVLDVGQNAISSLGDDFLFGLTNLQMIFIDCNCNFDFPNETNYDYQPFRWMPDLAYLFLSHNNINHFTPNLVANLTELYAIDLSENFLRTWIVGTTASLINASIDVSYNYLVFLPNQTYEEFHRMEAIDLTKNALICNCQVSFFLFLASLFEKK